MKKVLAIINFLVVIALIIWNFIAGSEGLNGNTIASLSRKYDNLFTPAGYAFSIWGLIYTGLLANGLYQLKTVFTFGKEDEFVSKSGPWLILANLANAAWLWAWLTENTGLSVIFILINMASLIIVTLKLNMEQWDAPIPLIVFVWWPISLYGGWIAVATIANLAAYLSKIGWVQIFNEVTWTVLMIILATLINLLMVFLRNMREFAAVGVWALMAISVRHSNQISLIQWTAISCAVILSAVIFFHGLRNWKTNPFRNLLKKS